MSIFNVDRRDYHTWAGILVFFVMFIGQAGVLSVSIPISAVAATVAAFLCMFIIEVKDKVAGGLFDWIDILAGMLCPIAADIVIALAYLLAALLG